MLRGSTLKPAPGRSISSKSGQRSRRTDYWNDSHNRYAYLEKLAEKHGDGPTRPDFYLRLYAITSKDLVTTIGTSW